MFTKSITSIEDTMARWFARIPALPLRARVWIVANLWWFVFAFALLTAVALVFAGLSLTLVAYVGRLGLVSPSEISSLIFALITTVLMFMAITPLKEYHYKGWRLLFIAELVSIASIVAECVIRITSLPLQSLVLSVLLTAVELYILFSVRKDFKNPVARSAKKAVVNATTVAKKLRPKK